MIDRMIIRIKSRKKIYFKLFIIVSFIICSSITVLQLQKVVESENLGFQLDLVGTKIKHSINPDFRLTGRIESEENFFKGIDNFNTSINKALIKSLGVNDGIIRSNAIVTFISKIADIRDEILIIVLNDHSYSDILLSGSIDNEPNGSLYLYSDINNSLIQDNRNEILLNISSTPIKVNIIANVSIAKASYLPNIIQETIRHYDGDHFCLTSKTLAESFNFTSENFIEFRGDFNLNNNVYSRILFSSNSEEILEDVKTSLRRNLQSDYVIDISIHGYIFTALNDLTILKQISFAHIKFLQFFILILCLLIIISSFNTLESFRIKNEQFFLRYSLKLYHHIFDLLFDSIIIISPAIFLGLVFSNTLLYLEEKSFNLSHVLLPANISVLPIIIITTILILIIYLLVNIGMFRTKRYPDSQYEKNFVLNPLLLTIFLSPVVIGFVFFEEIFLGNSEYFYFQIGLIIIIILLTISIIVISGLLTKIISILFHKIWEGWQISVLKDFYLLLKLWRSSYLRKGLMLIIITSLLCSLFVITASVTKGLEMSNDTSEGVPIYISENNVLNLTFINELSMQPEIKDVMPVISTISVDTDFNASNVPFINRGFYFGIIPDQIQDFYGSEIKKWGNNIDKAMKNFTGVLIPENKDVYSIGTKIDFYFYNNSLDSVDSIELEVQGYIKKWMRFDNIEKIIVMPIDILHKILIDSGEQFITKYLIHPKNDPVDTFKDIEKIVGSRELFTIDLKYYTLLNYTMKVPSTIAIHCILVIISTLLISENSQDYLRSKESRKIAKLSLSRNSTIIFIKIKVIDFLISVISIILTVVSLVAISIIFILETTKILITDVNSFIDSYTSMLSNSISSILFFIILLIIFQLLIDIIRFKREFNINLAVRHYE